MAFAITAGGAWTYTASSAHNEFQAGTTYTDTFSVASSDGTLTSSPSTSGPTSRRRHLTPSGALTITDPDSLTTFVAQAGTVGLYGTFAIDSAGAWTYTASSAHNAFMAGATYTDTFEVASTDGTLTSVTINIAGTADATNRSPRSPASPRRSPFSRTPSTPLRRSSMRTSPSPTPTTTSTPAR